MDRGQQPFKMWTDVGRDGSQHGILGRGTNCVSKGCEVGVKLLSSKN